MTPAVTPELTPAQQALLDVCMTPCVGTFG